MYAHSHLHTCKKIEGRRATGVEYLRKGLLARVRAKQRSGAVWRGYNSPQVLQLLGDRAAPHLEAAGVKVLHALPGVGANLVEHPGLLNIYE